MWYSLGYLGCRLRLTGLLVVLCLMCTMRLRLLHEVSRWHIRRLIAFTHRCNVLTVPTVTLLCHGWIDGQRKSLDDTSFLQRMTPRRPPRL